MVTLGDVEVTAATSALRPLLRRAIEQELKLANFGKTPFRKRYVLDASLVQLESASVDRISTTTCTVSVLIRTESNEAVAVIRGRATAEGAPVSAERTRTEAIRGAARSAIGKVPRALRETEKVR